MRAKFGEGAQTSIQPSPRGTNYYYLTQLRRLQRAGLVYINEREKINPQSIHRSSATSGTTNTPADKWMRLALPALVVAVAVVVGVERMPVEVPTCDGFVERKKNVPPRGAAKPTLLAND